MNRFPADAASDAERFAYCLVQHCSPVLAGLKSANMINFSLQNPSSFHKVLAHYRSELRSKNVSILLLQKTQKRALVYVYRERKLLTEFQKAGVSEFLQARGYTDPSLPAMLSHLKKRIAEGNGFPHEIGLFLGYPLHDVVGFIENDGQNSCCSGPWKVYDCAEEARSLFQKFNKCTAAYLRLFAAGRPITRLTVAA